MNVLDAICLVLRQAGEPLHYSDITERLIGQNLWSSSSEMPERTIEAVIAEHIRVSPSAARLYRVDWGVYDIKSPPISFRELDPVIVKFEPRAQSSEMYLRAAKQVLRMYGGTSLTAKEITKLAIEHGLLVGYESGHATVMQRHLLEESRRQKHRPKEYRWLFANKTRKSFGLFECGIEEQRATTRKKRGEASTRSRGDGSAKSSQRLDRSLTCVAVRILMDEPNGLPLHYSEIAAIAVARKAMKATDKNPVSEMLKQLYLAIEGRTRARETSQAGIAHVGNGYFVALDTQARAFGAGEIPWAELRGRADQHLEIANTIHALLPEFPGSEAHFSVIASEIKRRQLLPLEIGDFERAVCTAVLRDLERSATRGTPPRFSWRRKGTIGRSPHELNGTD